MTPLVANRLVLGYLLALLLTLPVTLLLGKLIAGVAGPWPAAKGAPVEAGDPFHLAMALSLGGYAAWVYRRYVRPHRQTLRWTPSSAVEGFEVALVLLVFGLGFGLLTSWLVPEPYRLMLARVLRAQTPWGWLAVYLGAGIFGPLIEEGVFRGFMLQSYAKRRGTRFALLAQAAIFALLHGEPVTAFGAFFVGWILGRAVLAGRSLKAAFAAHAANNLITTAAGALNLPYLGPAGEGSPGLALLGLGLMLLALWASTRRWPLRPSPPKEPGAVFSGSLALSLAAGLYLLLAGLFNLLAASG